MIDRSKLDLANGTRLVHRARDGGVHRARVAYSEDDQVGVLMRGEFFHSLSGAAQSITRNSVSGYRFWEIDAGQHD